jgi:serine/threonine protein kinase
MVVAVRPRYEIVCRLGSGGMADLYLARISGMAGFERLVVVKRPTPQLASDHAAMQSLFDEARICATLSHANIVQVNDVEVVDGQVSIVMEFLHGRDVSRLIRRLARNNELLPLDQAVAIGLGVLAGLHHAHERVGPDGQPLQIVHRDISPQNVFVTYDGAVKVVDFGIARAVTRRGKTEQGIIKGKPGYIAPEQLRGFEVDRRTDVWATAVLLYEMTTGSLPFDGDVPFEVLVAVATQEAPAPSTRISNYPRDLETIVMKGLARDPNARYATAEAMQLDLDAFARRRKLDLSPFRIAALMERVFAPQLGAWRAAQREGRSLAEHVAASEASGLNSVVDDPDMLDSTTNAHPPLPPGTSTASIAPEPLLSAETATARIRHTGVTSTFLGRRKPGRLVTATQDVLTSMLSRAEPRHRGKLVAMAIGLPALVIAGVVARSAFRSESRPLGASVTATAPAERPKSALAEPAAIAAPIPTASTDSAPTTIAPTKTTDVATPEVQPEPVSAVQVERRPATSAATHAGQAIPKRIAPPLKKRPMPQTNDSMPDPDGPLPR